MEHVPAREDRDELLLIEGFKAYQAVCQVVFVGNVLNERARRNLEESG